MRRDTASGLRPADYGMLRDAFKSYQSSPLPDMTLHSAGAQSSASARGLQLVAIALFSGAAVALSIFSYQSLRKHPETTTSSTPRDASAGNFPEDEHDARLASRARSGDYDEGNSCTRSSAVDIVSDAPIAGLILEQLARNRVFLGDQGLQSLRSAFVIIVGCGGVGSHAAAALARSGVGKLRVIDFDQVSLSSLNRHALATLADVATPKVVCIRRRIQQIAPWVDFDCRNEMFSIEAADAQLCPWDGKPPSHIVDAIDNIDTKVDLLKYCQDRSLPVVSSMGAGCKSDPTRIFIGDISTSLEDPLSRSTRRRLRAKNVTSGIPAVFSSEKSSPDKARLLPLPEEEFVRGEVGDLGVLPDFRVRILPVLGTMPAMFGMCLANHIMLELSRYPHEYLVSKNREKMYDSILSTLQSTEERLARWAGHQIQGLRIPVTQDDVGYLIEEVYHGKSIISGLPTRLVLIRWSWSDNQPAFDLSTYAGQKSSALELKNLVCMTKEEAARHEKEVLKERKNPKDVYPSPVLDKVRQRMEEESFYEKYR